MREGGGGEKGGRGRERVQTQRIGEAQRQRDEEKVTRRKSHGKEDQEVQTWRISTYSTYAGQKLYILAVKPSYKSASPPPTQKKPPSKK